MLRKPWKGVACSWLPTMGSLREARGAAPRPSIFTAVGLVGADIQPFLSSPGPAWMGMHPAEPRRGGTVSNLLKGPTLSQPVSLTLSVLENADLPEGLRAALCKAGRGTTVSRGEAGAAEPCECGVGPCL